MSDETQPIPRRFWWLKRLTLALVLVLVAVAALRWYWGYVMDSRLQATVAAIRQQGEPIELKDINQPTVPDQNNAAHYLQKARRQWPQVNGKLITETSWWDKPEPRPPQQDPIQDDPAYLQQCEPAFNLLHKAAQAKRADWDVKLTSPAFNMLLPHLGDMRQLTSLLDDAARRAHTAGNDRLAMKLIGHQLTIADRFDTSSGGIITGLVALSIRWMAADGIEAICPSLTIAAETERAAGPKQVHALVDRLMDDKAHWAEFIRAKIGDRVFAYDTGLAMIEGRMKLNHPMALSPGSPNWLSRLLLEPLFKRDLNYTINVYTAAIEALRKSKTWPQYQRHLKQHTPSVKPIEQRPWLHPLSSQLVFSSNAESRANFRTQVREHMAAAALAIRLYQHDHGGERPPSLHALVPNYLDQVPRDVFAKNDQPIGYKPHGVRPVFEDQWQGAPGAATQPARSNKPRLAILYSVGEDSEDDGGLVLIERSGELAHDARWGDQADAFFLLDPEPQGQKAKPTSPTAPPGNPPPATQPAPAAQS
jgi:hypothetical protein